MEACDVAGKAKKVLEKNWVSLGGKKGFTKPAQDIYPFQWNWDSSFIAYGYATYDLDKAVEELRALFSGQWSNGMVPHIVFHGADEKAESTYFPDPGMWDSRNTSPHAPRDVLTSGITQPPLHAMAVWRIYKNMLRKDRAAADALLDEFYPKLIALHRYLHTARDPEETGLVTIYHPWESGLDNSPRWDDALKKVEPVDMGNYKRRDTFYIEKKNRPSDEEYGQYLKLFFYMKEHGYDDAKLYKNAPFKIKDLAFSSILYMANRRLWRMANLRGGDDLDEIDGWMERFEKHLFEYCWNEQAHMFFDYDLIDQQQIKVQTVASLLPIGTGVITRRQKTAIEHIIQSTDFCGEQGCAINLVPSTSLKTQSFNHELYWRGPIWINMNWFLWKGFQEMGMEDVAHDLRQAMLDLVCTSGFREYYSPTTGEGLGAENFSWSAALAIDVLQ